MKQPALRFEYNQEAAQHNLSRLLEFECDVGRLLHAEKGTVLQPGSEFRPTSLLGPLFCFHPLWRNVLRWLLFGVDFPLNDIPEADRLLENILNFQRGNHKSARDNTGVLAPMLVDEVIHAWQLILPKGTHRLINGSVLGPVGLTFQSTINEFGEEVEKLRLTHDLSNNIRRLLGIKLSVNDRARMDELTPCRYGWAFLRFIHAIVWLRLCHPELRILLTKTDWKAAYRRLHNHPNIAVQQMVQWEEYELLALRMTFGGAPNPSCWSDLTEMACDAANDLVRSAWDPAEFSSPHVDKIPAEPVVLPADVEFTKAEPLAVDDLEDDLPRSDVFIDDAFCAFLERDLAKGRAVLPFLIHLLGRPLHPDEAITREDLLSLKKFLAEATPEEIKIILGWLVDTRRMLVALPESKVIGWSASLRTLISQRYGTLKQLEQLDGRLNHACYIIPGARHFMGRVRAAHARARKDPRRMAWFTGAELKDFELWIELLAYAGRGMSMNLLTFRHPTHRFRSDACLFAVGGYDLVTGRAWRWVIPQSLLGRASMNSLEFLGCYMCIAIAVHEKTLPMGSVVHGQTDNTSADGWMHKSNFDDQRPFQLEISRALARCLMATQSVNYSEWFKGDFNDVADSLTRDTHLSDTAIIDLLRSHVPEQLPPGFHISPVPPRIVLAVTSWLEQLTATTAFNSQPTSSKHAAGTCGCATCGTSNSTTTPSSTPSPAGSKSGLESPLPKPTDAGTLELKAKIVGTRKLPAALSKVPSAMWRRSLGLTNVGIHSWIHPVRDTTFYHDKSGSTKTPTPHPNNRRQQHQVSFGKSSTQQ